MSSTKPYEEGSNDEGEATFFESLDRIPSSVSFNFRLASSRSSYEDASRLSFSSALSAYSDEEEEEEDECEDYNVWMAQPMSIEERRHRLRQGMGLSVCNRAGFGASLRIKPTDISISKQKTSTSETTATATTTSEPTSDSSKFLGSSKLDVEETAREGDDVGAIDRTTSSVPSELNGTGNGEFEIPSGNAEDATGVTEGGLENGEDKFDEVITVKKEVVGEGDGEGDGETSAIYTIKNRNTGKEYVLNMENGNWNCTAVGDTQIGVQLTMDEFEKSVGHSPIVKELVRRECGGPKSTGEVGDTKKTTSTTPATTTTMMPATTATMTPDMTTTMTPDTTTTMTPDTTTSTPPTTTTTTTTTPPTTTTTATTTIPPTTTTTTATTETTVKKKKKKIKGVSWLKNIKVVATSMTGSSSSSAAVTAEKEPKSSSPSSVEKDPKNSPTADKEPTPTSISPSTTEKTTGAKSTSPHQTDWMKVHRRGKPFKELTGLYMSQEIEAHQGSIWCMTFSSDGVFMASAGENGEIHVWQVFECDSVSSSQRPFTNGSAVQQLPQQEETSSEDVPQTQNLKNGKSFVPGKSNSIPEYVVVPETIFSLSEKPFCTFEGHVDDVLCLSWSKSQFLLSSSMDKTVRLWDMETKTCLKVFGHNDYVTSIQFNPVDNRYFISGSLDAKIRIWSIPDRQVVDWRDLSEMVTAACYTPDGEGAFVGTHKGTCKLYEMSDSKLQQEARLDLHFKKNKSEAKKITGFQFSPETPSEVLVTSADSQIRVYGSGNEMIHKFRGLRNTSSQTAAMFTPDGRYVVCASEDSQVYVWKREKDSGIVPTKGKTWVTTESYENFQCKDVSVAVPWPGSCRNEPPPSSKTAKASSTSTTTTTNKTSSENENSTASPVASPASDNESSAATVPVKPLENENSTASPVASSENDAVMSTNSENSHNSPSSSTLCTTAEDPSSTVSKRQKTKKKSSVDQSTALARTDEDHCSNSRNASRNSRNASTSTSNTSSWLWSGTLSSIPGLSLPSSSALSSRWNIGGRGSAAPAATAWGLVVVTAGLGGEIRVYQNFGLPLKLNR